MTIFGLDFPLHRISSSPFVLAYSLRSLGYSVEQVTSDITGTVMYHAALRARVMFRPRPIASFMFHLAISVHVNLRHLEMLVKIGLVSCS